MKKIIQDLKVVRKKVVNDYHFLLTLQSSENLPMIIPGQFVQVLVENAPAVFLRRPFSIHDVDYEENTISLYIKILGNGTRQLSYVEEGDFLNVIYPLGNGFSFPDDDNILLVGGGCGVAPMLYLAKYLNFHDIMPSILLGARTKTDIPELDEYLKYGPVYSASDDGSCGEPGFVSQHSILKNKFSKIYTCGPEPMMKAIARIAAQTNTPCEASLENTMACGFGVCLCCVTPTMEGHKCVCTEGPVFNTSYLKW